jgi:uncharacterized protein
MAAMGQLLTYTDGSSRARSGRLMCSKSNGEGSESRIDIQMSLVSRAFIFLAVSSAFSYAGAASFDCKKAKSRNEQLICSNSELSSLDEVLNKVYQRAYNTAANKSVVRQSQRDWLESSELDACRQAECLKLHFSERIALLKDVAANGEPLSQWSGIYVRYSSGKVDTDAATISVLGLRSGRLYVSGTALWYGPQAKIGQVNDGQMTGYSDPIMAGESANFDADGCSASLRLRGTILEVKDETGCGGLNVTFNGTYRRK